MSIVLDTLLAREAELEEIEAIEAENAKRQRALDERRVEAAKVHARTLYGDRTGTGGGAAPASLGDPLARFQQRLASAKRDSYGQLRGVSREEIDDYATQRFVEHVKAEVRAAALRPRGSVQHVPAWSK